MSQSFSLLNQPFTLNVLGSLPLKTLIRVSVSQQIRADRVAAQLGKSCFSVNFRNELIKPQDSCLQKRFDSTCAPRLMMSMLKPLHSHQCNKKALIIKEGNQNQG